MGQLLDFVKYHKKQEAKKLHTRWEEYFHGLEHQDLLDLLVYEHENNFPLRNSEDLMDQMKHKALVQVLNERAQTDFLRNFLKEIADPS